MQKSIVFCLAAAASLCSAQNEITVPGTRSYPESITSTKDGTIFIGSLGHGNVYRVAKGSTTPVEFIKPGAGGLANVLGVLADEKSKTLWVCSPNLDGKGDPTSLKAYDLKTGASKGGYPLPGGPNAFCNDIAIAADGSAYVADTRLNSVLMLKKGAKALEVVAKDDRLAGADGLDFATKNQLIVNSVSSGKLFRLDLGADGKATSITEVATSRPLERPDGMRTIGTNKFLLAENAGRMDVVVISGNTATVTPIMEGKEATPAVTVARGMAWLVEGKLNYRDAAMKDKDPGAFKLFGMPMPK
jgi:DNA-binding beta-propeller fold protein YncE